MKNKSKILRAVIIGVVILAILIIPSSIVNIKQTTEEISYSQARTLIKNSQIVTVKLEENTLIAKLYTSDSETIYNVKVPSVEQFSEFINSYQGINYKITKNIYKIIQEKIDSLISIIIFAIIIIYGISIVLEKLGYNDENYDDEEDDNASGEINIAKYKGNSGTPNNSELSNTITFKDIAGIDKEKAEVEEVVNMLKNPDKYIKQGAKIPKGILLTGEPGTGKTLIAKAIANEAEASFITCDASSFENEYVGVGAGKMRKIFKVAKQNAPTIIFIDEIDAIAQIRYGDYGGYAEQTLNQLLTLMDGFTISDQIIVIAATNMPEVLDKAITRPGRFDRIIEIPLPDRKGRREILEVHSRNKNFIDNKQEILDDLAKKTSGYSGAELANILNEAAIITASKEKKGISKEEIEEAFVKVILGISKEDKEVSEKEKICIAIHEAGHTVTSRITRPQTKILQVSIVPRGSAGGYNLFNDEEEKFLYTKKELQNEIIVSLGGKAAEQLFFNDITVGASCDLQEANQLAHSMIYKYAMGTESQLVRIYGKQEYNDKLEEKMLPEVEKIVDESYKRAFEIVSNNFKLLIEIANMLKEKSTLNSSELEELFSQYGV